MNVTIGIPSSSHVMTYWFALSSLFFFIGAWTWLAWWQIRGMRGALLATMLISLAIICACQGIVHANQPVVPIGWVLAVSRTAYVPLFLASLVSVDLYLADHNHHKAFSARAYYWYCAQMGRPV